MMTASSNILGRFHLSWKYCRLNHDLASEPHQRLVQLQGNNFHLAAARYLLQITPVLKHPMVLISVIDHRTTLVLEHGTMVLLEYLAGAPEVHKPVERQNKNF